MNSTQVTEAELEELKLHAYDGWTKPAAAPKGRTDVHSPKNLVTEDYEYLYSWDQEQPGALVGVVQSGVWAEWHAAGPVLPDVSSSKCTHCGAWLRYVALLRYIPTGQYLYVGETCLENRFSLATADFQRLRKAAELDRQEQRIVKLWAEFHLVHPEVDWAALEIAAEKNTFIADVLRRGRQYGTLSEKQLAAIQKSVVRDAEYAAKKAAEVDEIKVPVIEGKVSITGVVLTRKWQDSDYGSTLKCLVKVTTPAGIYKLWGSVPAAICDVEVGDTVSFSATVERSKDDESFGFYKRPTKASKAVQA